MACFPVIGEIVNEGTMVSLVLVDCNFSHPVSCIFKKNRTQGKKSSAESKETEGKVEI